jgi:hypothetical protein
LKNLAALNEFKIKLMGELESMDRLPDLKDHNKDANILL